MLTTPLAFAFVLGVLVFVHELGHFLLARWHGVRVHVFSLGFGPKLLSFKRGINDKMIYNRAFQLDYVRELRKGLSYTLSAHRVGQSPAGNLLFDYSDSTDGSTQYLDEIVSTHFGFSVRYAPNEKY